MKLVKRIAAAFTALALMFTLNDPAALGSMLSAVSSAYAVSIVKESQVLLTSSLPEPVAGTPLWDTTSVDFNTSDGHISIESVTWYANGDYSNPLKPKTVARYDTQYSVKLTFTIKSLNCYFTPSAKIMYYDNGKLAELVPPKDGEKEYSGEITVEGETYYTVLSGNYERFTKTAKPTAADVRYVDYATSSIDQNTTLNSNHQLVFDNQAASYDAAMNNILAKLPTDAYIIVGDSSKFVTDDDREYFNSLRLSKTIQWTEYVNNVRSFRYEGGTKFNAALTSSQTFMIKGLVTTSETDNIDSTSQKEWYVYAKITVNAANEVDAPVASETSGGSFKKVTNIELISKNAQRIYYTISENDFTSFDPADLHGEENDTIKLYDAKKGGIVLAGSVGVTKTYYIKAIAFNDVLEKSAVTKLIYSVYLAPTDFTNIGEIRLTVKEPKNGGDVLDTNAELDMSCVPENSIAQISQVSWIGSFNNGRTEYNANYSMSVQITPNRMFAFFDTHAYVNGNVAKCTTNEDGTLTVTFVFPHKTEKLTDYKILDLKSISVPNGTSVSKIGDNLPVLVYIEAPTGTLLEAQCPVKWDLASATTPNGPYNPKIGDAQKVTFTGTVTLPDYIDSTVGGTSVTITVNVEEAGRVVAPWADPLDSTDGHTAFYEETKVTLTTLQSYATIYYTIGTDPNIADPTVTGGTAFSDSAPIILSGIPGETVDYYIKAIATAPGMKESSVSTFVYTVKIPKLTAEAPTANVASGTYQYALNIALNTVTVGADVYYSMDPSAKKESYTKYTGVITLNTDPNTSKTFRIFCYSKDTTGRMFDSDVVTYTYTINIPKNKALAPYPSKNAGEYEETVKLTLACDTSNTEIYYTLDSTAAVKSFKKYAANTVITLKKDKYDSTVYLLRTYAKSTDPNVDDSPLAEYKFTVGKDYGVKSIELEKRPLKYSYYLGELINVTGGQIKVTYEDGKTESILMDEDMIEEFDSWVLGQQSVVVNFHGATTTFNIVVRKKDDNSSDAKDDNKKDDNKKDDNQKDNTAKDDTTKDDSSKDNTAQPDNTVSPPTMKGSAVKGWDQLLLKVKAAKAESRLVIYLNGNTSVPADIINAAISKKATLEFVVDDVFSWVLDAGALKKSKTVPSLSVGIKSTDVYIPSVLVDMAGDSEAARLHTYGENKLGAVLYVKTGCKEKNRFVNMYIYNEETHLLDFVSTSKVTASTGVAQAVPTVAGDYVIMLDTKTMLPGDADNSTRVDAKDAAAILKIGTGVYVFDATCDYNGDGFVNALDAAAILRDIVGIM